MTIPSMTNVANDINNHADSDESSAGHVSMNEQSEKNKMSEVMTYDEIVQQLASDESISIEDASKLIDTKLIKQIESGVQVIPTYRIFTQYVEVTSTYKPQIKWYCETIESNEYCDILKINNTYFNMDYNGTVKSFQGELYTNLENSNCIFYMVNGDFKSGGNTSYTGTGKIGLNGVLTINFSISGNTSSAIYSYKDGRYYVNNY